MQEAVYSSVNKTLPAPKQHKKAGEDMKSTLAERSSESQLCEHKSPALFSNCRILSARRFCLAESHIPACVLHPRSRRRLSKNWTP